MKDYIFYQKFIDAIEVGIKEVLNEELAISATVSDEADRLKQLILNDAKNRQTEKTENFSFKDGELTAKLFGINYKINYTVYNATDCSHLRGYLDSASDTIKHTMSLNLLRVNGQPYQDYFDNSIYHELLHVFQYEQSKRNALSDPVMKSRYETIRNIFNDTTLDETYRVFANALYASFDFEQDAMVHGLYGEMISMTDGVNWKGVLLRAKDYEYVYDISWCLDNLELFDSKRFGMTKEAFKHLIEDKLKMFKTKIGKMIMKFQQRELKSGSTIPHSF